MLNTADFGGSLRTQSGENIRAARPNIRNIDACPCERGRPTDDTAVHILLLAETTGNLTQALGIETNMRPHAYQSRSIAETIFVDRLMYNGHALGLGQQDGKLLLPVCHKARMK